MKQKVVAWTAAILIVALVSAAFLRPAPSEFGYGDKLYTPVREELELLSGSEHFIVENRGIEWHNGVSLELRIVQKDPERLYTRSTIRIKDNKELDHDSSCGILERYDNGVWLQLGEAYPNIAFDAMGRPPASTIEYKYIIGNYARYLEDGGGTHYPLDYSMLGTPGRYRVSLYFRECFNYGTEEDTTGKGPLYTTCDELITVQFELDIPKMTDKRFDIAVGLNALQEFLSYEVELFVRSNDAGIAVRDEYWHYTQENPAPYLLVPSLTLEKRFGSKYIPVPEEDAAAVCLSKIEETYRMCSRDEYLWDMSDVHRIDRVAYYCIGIQGENFEPSAEYRVTMNFVENPDGSGDTYTLRLRLKFAE